MKTTKKQSKTNAKPSEVWRVKNPYKDFYKNTLGGGDKDKGLANGKKIIESIIGNQDDFQKYVMKKYEEMMSLMSLKYGGDFMDDNYHYLQTFLESALNNGGKGKVRNLDLLKKKLEECEK